MVASKWLVGATRFWHIARFLIIGVGIAMKAKRAIGRTALCLAQSAMLFFGNAGFALAATSSFSSADMTRIASSERSVFGSARNNSLSSESRLRALETNLFGGVKKGSVEKRLEAVEKALEIDRNAYLAPPQAGKLDQLVVERAPVAVAPQYYDVPKSPSADLIHQAMEQYSKGDLATAERTFKRALSIDKDNADAYFNLGVLYEAKGETQRALDHYSRAQALNPGDSELRETVQSLRSKVAQEKTAKVAEENRAQAERQSAQRRDSLRQAVTDASNDYKKGNFSEAVRKLERVASEAPSDPDVQYALGQAYRAKGENERARTAYNRAVSIDPTSSLYKNALSELNKAQPIANAPRATQYDNSYQGDNSLLANNSLDTQPFDPAPPGQITPFSGRASRNADSFSSSGPGFSFGSNPLLGGGGMTTGFRSGTRLKRAVAGGAAGAAVGALLGSRGSGGVKRGALQGAVLGGMLGYFTGGP